MQNRISKQIRVFLPFMIVYAIAAVLFLMVKGLLPGFSFSFVIKAVPALFLSFAVIIAHGLETRERIALLLGALLCGAGDVILDIDRVRLFVPGLAAFLLGHVGFLVFFAFRFDRRVSRKYWIIPVLLLAVVMGVVLMPRLGSLLVPVLGYLLVITAMTVLAVLSRIHCIAAIGAFIFMISDTFLALAKFVFNGQPPPMVTIPVYFTGLFLLGFGILVFDQERTVLYK